MTTEQPDWLLQLQRDLCTPVMVPDGAIINWDQCRDRFLIPLLQRLEPQTRRSHPAIVRQLLQRRLAGDDVAAELSAASLAATAAATAAASLSVTAAASLAAIYATSAAATERTAQLADLQAAIAATAAASLSASLAATAAASLAAIYATSAAATERTAQLADLQAAIAAATQPAAFPVDLAALRDSTFSDGLTAAPHIEVLRGGPDPRLPAELPTNNLAPVRSADRPWEEPGWCDARGQCWWTVDDRTMDRRRWTLVNPALLGGGWVLPHWAIPAIPAAETNPAEVQP